MRLTLFVACLVAVAGIAVSRSNRDRVRPGRNERLERRRQTTTVEPLEIESDTSTPTTTRRGSQRGRQHHGSTAFPRRRSTPPAATTTDEPRRDDVVLERPGHPDDRAVVPEAESNVTSLRRPVVLAPTTTEQTYVDDPSLSDFIVHLNISRPCEDDDDDDDVDCDDVMDPAVTSPCQCDRRLCPADGEPCGVVVSDPCRCCVQQPCRSHEATGRGGETAAAGGRPLEGVLSIQLVDNYPRAVNACNQMQCPRNKVCMLNIQGLPMCRCLSVYHCKNVERRPICSTDGVTFKNKCLLRVEECATNRRIRIQHRGACRTPDEVRSTGVSASHRRMPTTSVDAALERIPPAQKTDKQRRRNMRHRQQKGKAVSQTD